ncbi:MAG: disulfide bond formation protein B [Pseudomonadota bacterium]
MSVSVKANAKDPGYKWGGLALVLATLSILSALGFEHIGGYSACELCLQQRYAYYAGVPLLFLALVLLSGDERKWAGVLFFIVALAFLANAGLGVYHAGAEWGYWPGPATCSGGGALGTLDLTAGLADTKPVIPCDQPEIRVLGLSFAGWNVVTSLIIHIAALQSAAAAMKRG